MIKKTKSPYLTKLKIDPTKVPLHVAIIMDGNRRWAAKHNLPNSDGHKAGAKNLEEIIEHAAKIGIKHVTVYALSTENWRKRTIDEVRGIFHLLVSYAKEKKAVFQRTGVRFTVLGDFHAFPSYVKNALKSMLNLVLDKETIKFNVALNYGGRDEIVNAIKKIIKAQHKPEEITEELVSKYMYTHDQPDPELIIRPGGEFRISNFLLWQNSYAELYFSNVLWPEFGPKELEKAIYWYQQRDRRLGK